MPKKQTTKTNASSTPKKPIKQPKKSKPIKHTKKQSSRKQRNEQKQINIKHENKQQQQTKKLQNIDRKNISNPTNNNSVKQATDGLTPQKQIKLKKQISISSQNFVICKINNFQNDYEIVDKLGQGSFGTVFRVKHKKLGLMRALKKIKKSQSSQFSSFDEIQVLQKLDHVNILKIYQFYETDQYYFIVTDIFQGKQLFDQITACDKFSQQIASRIIRQVLITLRYTHSMNVAHRDIKPENILVRQIENKKKLKIKIIDWGLGTFLKQQFTDRVCGTPQYAAPQIFQGKYSVLCDMWSLGVLAFVMLTGNMPFKGTNTMQTITQVKRSIINYRKSGFNDLSTPAKQFINKLIQKQPSKRMSASQALTHPWITQFQQKKIQPQFLKQTLVRLKQLNIDNHFGVAVINLINNHYSSNQQREKLSQIFKFLDTNGDGVLSKQQLIQGYSKIYGQNVAKQIAQQTFSKLDVNKNGTLQYSEFVAFGLRRQKQKQSQKLKQAFQMFDRDHNGTISWAEVGKILEGKIEGLFQDDIREIVDQVSIKKDNELTFSQFEKYMHTMLQKIDSIRQSKRRQSQIKSQGSQQNNSKQKIDMHIKRTQSLDQMQNQSNIKETNKPTLKNKK